MHPIEFSVMTAMVVPLVLQLQPHAPNRRRWNALVLITVLGIPISLSRSGFVGLAVGLVVLAISWPAERLRRKLVQGFVLALVLFVAVPGLTGTITNMFTGVSSDNSITTRTSDYAAVQPYIEARPIFGRGVGTFTPPHYRILDNQYLLTLIEAGAAGLAALITFVVVSALTAQQGWNRAPPGASRDLARAVFASILVAATSLAFFDGFSFHGFSGLFFLLAGMGGAAWRLASAESDRAFLRPGG